MAEVFRYVVRDEDGNDNGSLFACREHAVRLDEAGKVTLVENAEPAQDGETCDTCDSLEWALEEETHEELLSPCCPDDWAD